ncbi:flagellar hook-length control protein FliK [Parachitinimonas caeni]|uniref:Flagellar hook-length control protein FliK n=1 Tax=Parachitinimonas caeni TaxID=3031301 RepID=A0ABT7E4Q3_9NEIS|nr:flagellar hook-length control protein FliK [Parachitinimonas caeni]MDK2126415.1 flagellar hook-length control protein FliK [Parachitinimonas caeni]
MTTPTDSAATQLQLYAKTIQAPLIQISDTLETTALLFTVGEKVKAEVRGELQGGRFAVMVKDQLLDLNLPRNTQPGEKLDLTVLANSPKLTFLLQRENASPPPAAPTTPAANDAEARNVKLSPMAQLLGNLIAEPPADAEPKLSQLAQVGPLFAGKLPEPATVAGALRQAIGESGLFYESHQAEWISGQRPLASLLNEPQAKAQPQSRPAVPQTPTPLVGKEEDGQQATTEAGKGALLPPFAQTADEPPIVRQLVQQQLETLDQRQINWQGPVWPGQVMRWEIDEPPEQGKSGREGEEGMVWHTRLHLDLPHLGGVTALLALRGHTVDLRFQVADADTASQIRANDERLLAGFEAAGLELASRQVDVGDDEVTGRGG